jgi:hypothetical protein
VNVVNVNLERPGGSAIDARTTQHPGYAVSQRKRKRIEECFGWLRTIALLRKVRHRGIFKVGWVFTFAARGLQLSPYEESGVASSVSRGRSVPADPKMNPRDTSGCSQNPSQITKSLRMERI